jgi:hypothetical protein
LIWHNSSQPILLSAANVELFAVACIPCHEHNKSSERKSTITISCHAAGRLWRLWKELVKLYHPDRFAHEPDKLETYHSLCAAINRAKDAATSRRCGRSRKTRTASSCARAVRRIHPVPLRPPPVWREVWAGKDLQVFRPAHRTAAAGACIGGGLRVNG